MLKLIRRLDPDFARRNPPALYERPLAAAVGALSAIVRWLTRRL